ncbi:MAG: hypothetical protein Q9163_003013 [Psora crenata]
MVVLACKIGESADSEKDEENGLDQLHELYGGSIMLKYYLQRPQKWHRSLLPTADRLCQWHFSGASTRKYAAVENLGSYPKPGERLHGFTLTRTKQVPELQINVFHLQHEKTGAEYLHVARDDKNNVFSIGFKTNPPDDTGVPHILEHTTLCGSERYPVRDPFFKMLRRSLSNFMNAFTSSDHTSYPFATTNPQDFNNLLSVYLDATLSPLLKESDFMQEGWRIGPENPQRIVQAQGARAKNEKMIFKGVVYNEMKGQMSDSGYLFYIKFQDHIFPAINNSGGDPPKITDLTYTGLKDFHARHYHPSNAKLLTYGDIPLANHTREINTYLDKFQKTQVDRSIKEPISLEGGPISYAVRGPLDPLLDPAMQYKTSTSWIMGESSDILRTFSLGILSSLLLEGYGSPLYQALVESGLGTDFSANTGFDGSGKLGIFSVGLNGVKQDNVPKVKEAVQAKLQETYQQGFEKGKVDGLLHQLELALRHKTANFGMSLVQRLQPGWFNGVDPFDALAWDETINAFKQKFTKGGYLEGLLQKYLLTDRTMTFTMEPSPTYADDMRAEESSRLTGKLAEAASKAGSENVMLERLTARELELIGEQEKAPDQDLSSLPTLRARDIPRQLDRKYVRDSSLGPVKVQWREASTNGLTYFRAINLLEGLPMELRMLLPLFTDSILRLGTKGKTMEEIEDLIKVKTGGISVSYYSSASPSDICWSVEGLSFSGYALDSNVTAMYELLRMIIQETDYDGPDAEGKIRQLLQSDASGALDAIASSGHSYARWYAEAGLVPQGLLNEQVGGLTQVQHIANLANRRPSEGLADVMMKLKAIQQFAISNSSSFRVAITCGLESSSANETALASFLSTLPTECRTARPEPLPTSGVISRATFFPLPYQVSYTAASLRTVPYTHPASASLHMLSQLLTHKHMHHEIREKGGAYGGGAYARGLSGLFGFYSYRDPSPQNTLKIFGDAGTWARDKQWTDQDLEEAKLSTFQNVDAPQSVSEEGMTRFLSGIDEEMEQRKREQLLDVKKEDIRDVAQKYLVEGMKDAKIAVLGEKKGWIGGEEEGWNIKNVELVKPSETAGASDLSAGDLDNS